MIPNFSDLKNSGFLFCRMSEPGQGKRIKIAMKKALIAP
jgi:hypothetical protein